MASLLCFKLQGDDAGLPVALGHPREHGGQARRRPPRPAADQPPAPLSDRQLAKEKKRRLGV